jgi:uncharacterized peroxidase-related enzyme
MTARQDERDARANEPVIVDGLPAGIPGIIAAMRLSPALGAHLRGLANALLVEAWPGSTLTRGERELIATATSAANDCFYCMDSHGAFACELLGKADGVRAMIDGIKAGGGPSDPKLDALISIARSVQKSARGVTRGEIEYAKAAGASDADTQLAVLIASAFCMYNRMVDGLRAPTPPSAKAYTARAVQIAEHGYDAPQLNNAIPGR